MPLDYVIVTPARNEAPYIEHTLRSVAAQTVPPLRWVVVSDGSTDGTDEVVRRHQPACPWLELLRLPDREGRDFAAKVRAFEAGYERVRGLRFEVVVNLDADVSFPPDYFAFLLERFEAMPELGLAGTHYVEDGFHSYEDSFIDVHHVNGQCQLFRRRCYEDIGGYVPIRGGGIDWVAVRMARMKGWLTYSFHERVFEHHRKMGTASGGELQARMHYGRKDYFLGGHPLWELLRGAFQMTRKPYVLGGLGLWAGYFGCWLMRRPRAVPPEVMAFHQADQMRRLKALVGRGLRTGRRAAHVRGTEVSQ